MASIKEIKPKPLNALVGSALGHETKPVLIPGINQKKVDRQNWDDLMLLAQDHAAEIRHYAASIQEVNEIVAQHGCHHPKEYEIVSKRAMEYLEKFTNDFLKAYERHKERKGPVMDEDENALLISVFEDYRSWHTYLSGTMSHIMISFTEFALEANDRMKEKEAAERGEVGALTS